ncbi:septal ring lytic transglycosylase RlpA family protein [Flavobacterium hungaricum]|uniref:Probable endolytic peptidoglycan transglycosylase RlpA n=1 Tax=Flavobacterium hungaricum TaxID=2082725 RepID=A0ABR9TRE4_9FLAO|nr:septal ring lytic transglycosylase RlpA family protein [Flavobacterium hungaricum]MBE8727900.1 septal ring lytic transglycosylase RlpA family protein [Flavobacterium hungaricum]
MKKLLLFIIFLIAAAATAQETLKDSCNNNIKYELYKTNAHASYYHDKFNGRKTASGRIFNNNDLTAAHRKFPFGTMLKITNEINNNFVIVKITDRGPFVKGREIDLSKRAFMQIASNKKSGLVYVKIEILK